MFIKVILQLSWEKFLDSRILIVIVPNSGSSWRIGLHWLSWIVRDFSFIVWDFPCIAWDDCWLKWAACISFSINGVFWIVLAPSRLTLVGSTPLPPILETICWSLGKEWSRGGAVSLSLPTPETKDHDYIKVSPETLLPIWPYSHSFFWQSSEW